MSDLPAPYAFRVWWNRTTMKNKALPGNRRVDLTSEDRSWNSHPRTHGLILEMAFVTGIRAFTPLGGRLIPENSGNI